MIDSTKSINQYGDKIWKNEIGEYHRLDGPAIIRKNGSQYWYINDKSHRLDGPAYIGADGTQEWWIHDVNITNEVNKWMKCNNVSYPFDEEIQALFKLRFL
jgi:hypothetical protein